MGSGRPGHLRRRASRPPPPSPNRSRSPNCLDYTRCPNNAPSLASTPLLRSRTSPSAADVKAVLESVGIEADSDRLDKLISELEGKDINELIASGSEKLASVPSGGAGGAAASGGAAAAGGSAEAEAAPEAAKEEEKEESDEDMGFGLFD
jgi:large subunit ribosomal protein LP2